LRVVAFQVFRKNFGDRPPEAAEGWRHIGVDALFGTSGVLAFSGCDSACKRGVAKFLTISRKGVNSWKFFEKMRARNG
jgi:hypothetical protein